MTTNWNLEDYSQWSRSLAVNMPKNELQKRLAKVEKESHKASECHLRAINKTSSMQGNSQHRAQAGNVVSALYEEVRALKDALEIQLNNDDIYSTNKDIFGNPR